MTKSLQFAFALLIFSLNLNGQFYWERVNPRGMAMDMINVTGTADGSFFVSTNGPIILRYKPINDSNWTNSRHQLIYCAECRPNSKVQALNQQIFVKGNHLTRDGGQSWQLIDPIEINHF